MSNRTYLGRSMQRFVSSPQFDGFSKVTIVVTDEIEYSAGTDTGRTLRITNPWGTPQMAQDILDSIKGFQYQPYVAEKALIDPAMELGDGVTANNVYGGVYTQLIRFGGLLTATVSAPEDEELNHEYPYKSKPNKEITREAKLLRAEMRVQADLIAMEVSERKTAVEELTAQLQIQAGLIAAKVSKTGGDSSSFGWELTDSDWTIKANSREILKATKDGLAVYGKIEATSGKIGGFDILANYLSYNNQTWGGTNSTGIYLGPSGFQLGKYFKVDSAGNLTARSGTFTGSVNAGNIRYGGDYGTFSGNGISSGSIYGNRMVANTISTAYTSPGINSSLGRADAAYNVTHGGIDAHSIGANTLHGKYIYLNGHNLNTRTLTFTDGDGTSRSINYVGW